MAEEKEEPAKADSGLKDSNAGSKQHSNAVSKLSEKPGGSKADEMVPENLGVKIQTTIAKLRTMIQQGTQMAYELDEDIRIANGVPEGKTTTNRSMASLVSSQDSNVSSAPPSVIQVSHHRRRPCGQADSKTTFHKRQCHGHERGHQSSGFTITSASNGRQYPVLRRVRSPIGIPMQPATSYSVALPPGQPTNPARSGEIQLPSVMDMNQCIANCEAMFQKAAEKHKTEQQSSANTYEQPPGMQGYYKVPGQANSFSQQYFVQKRHLPPPHIECRQKSTKRTKLSHEGEAESEEVIVGKMKNVVVEQMMSRFGAPCSKVHEADEAYNKAEERNENMESNIPAGFLGNGNMPEDNFIQHQHFKLPEALHFNASSTDKNGPMPAPWPSNVVPFVIDPSFTDKQRNNILLAFNQYHDNTCVRFKPRENERDYVLVRRAVGEDEPCTSNLGYQGGEQTITLNDKCVQLKGTILHELMHVLGFDHEQSRRDRDEYVLVNWDNIMPGYERNFKQRQQMTDLDYDYGSIMHYPPYAFAEVSSVPTILPRRDYPLRMIGQRVHLSNLDQDKINQIYRCDKYPVRPSAYLPTAEERTDSYMSNPEDGYYWEMNPDYDYEFRDDELAKTRGRKRSASVQMMRRNRKSRKTHRPVRKLALDS